MQGKKYVECKKEIRSVLLTYPKGANLQEFLKAYKQLLGERLPSRELGFHSDIEFLRSIPDVVQLSTDTDGKIHLFGVADESSEHIQKLVSKQRTTKPNNKSKILSRPKFSRTECNVKTRPIFVPGALRAQIFKVLHMYPEGITLPAFVLAYRKLFNKYLSLEKGLETLEIIINAIPELEIKDVKNEKKIYIKDFHAKNSSNSHSEENKLSSPKGLKNQLSEETSVIDSNFDKSGISESVKQNFQMLLEKCSDGMLAIHFPALYEKVIGQPFLLHELGYNSVIDLVDALPSIFTRILDPTDGKNWLILPANHSKVVKDFFCIDQYTEKTELDNPKYTNEKDITICGGIPNDAASPFSSYKHPQIPENVNLDEYVPIFVSAIVNPSLFWFQLQTDEIAKEFEELEQELQNFYNSYAAVKYKMNPVHIMIGASCVVQCPDDKQWYRAVIKSIPSLELVNVLSVDYGSRENVSKSVLRYVRKDFFQYPAFAFRAELAGLKPANNATTWDVRSQQRFIKLCESASIMANLQQIDKDAFSTYLCDTDKNDLHLNDVLVAEGYAELIHNANCNENSTTSPQIPVVRAKEVHGENEENCAENFDKSCINSAASSPSYSSPSDAEFEKKNLQMQTNSNVMRKLSFTSQKDENENSELTSLRKNWCRRYIKRVKLCEEVNFCIINMEDKLYISGGDLTTLFWNDKDHNFLAERLVYKDIVVPTVVISRKDNIDFHEQCKWFNISDCESLKNNCMVLYPLEWAYKILNIFGHPSVCLRHAIQHEMKIFNPNDSLWTGFLYEENVEVQEVEAKFNKLCLYDLKIKFEALRVKRLRLLTVGKNNCDEIQKLENLQNIVERRIKHIETICLQYSSCL